MSTVDHLESSGIDHLQYRVLQSSVCRSSLYGLAIGIGAVVLATFIIGYQHTGNISLDAVIVAHEDNVGLRFLYLVPFLLAFWGQHAGLSVASHAENLLQQQGDEMRLETSNWKLKSHYDSTHDSMTGLPNRIEFYSRLKAALLLAERADLRVLLVSLDMDGFKDINDVYGNRCGDHLLAEMAERLRSVVSEDDVVSRTGGDEFTVLCTLDDVNTEGSIVERLNKVFENAFIIEGKEITARASMGVSVFPDNGKTAEDLMQKAELAMHAAKQDSRGYREYSPDLGADNNRRVLLLKDLKTAIDEGGLSLNFQPKIDLKSRSIRSVEALVRWYHPEQGQISPVEFIPLAEQNRLIQSVSQWVIRSAIKQASEWQHNGLNIGMAINISTYDLADDELPGIINTLLNDAGITADTITLEITEGSIMHDQQHARSIIHALNDLGLHISIDDFGTGYSSLAYLSRLSVDEIKIDRTFVMGMKERPRDATIVKATIDMAHNLGYAVTAEGIDNNEAMEQLYEWGCDTGQGYYFSPPLTAEELEAWLQESGWQQKTGT